MGGGVSSFLLYLSELSFVIGITAEKNKQTNKKNKIQPQITFIPVPGRLVGFPCKPGSPIKIPAKTFGAKKKTPNKPQKTVGATFGGVEGWGGRLVI